MRPISLLRSCALSGALAIFGDSGASLAQTYDYGNPSNYADNSVPYADPQYSNAPADQVEGAPVDPAYFQQQLSPYGQWVQTAEYGLCWVPAGVGPEWRPYTLGRWVYTVYGWTWVSEEPFGWATYHYGRWAMVAGVGWVWAPGSVWGPAWVSWQQGGGYCGWAPLSPGFSFGLSITAGDFRRHHIPAEHYNFVAERSMCDPHVRRNIVAVQHNTTIINRTTNITNISVENHRVVNRGVDVGRLERATGQRVERAAVRQVNRPADLRNARPGATSKEVAIVRPSGTTRLGAVQDVRGKNVPSAPRIAPTATNNASPKIAPPATKSIPSVPRTAPATPTYRAPATPTYRTPTPPASKITPPATPTVNRNPPASYRTPATPTYRTPATPAPKATPPAARHPVVAERPAVATRTSPRAEAAFGGNRPAVSNATPPRTFTASPTASRPTPTTARPTTPTRTATPTVNGRDLQNARDGRVH